MDDRRARIVDWVGREILPHEADLRRWLSRGRIAPSDVDDVIQDAYCRLAALDDVEHITSPRAYLFQVARSLVLNRLRRARIVRIEAVAEFDTLNLVGDDPSPERIIGARRDLIRALEAIVELPERCRRIFEMRKIEGVPQKEIARRLGVTERVVENDVMKAIRCVLKAFTDAGSAADGAGGNGERDERTRDRAANR